MKWLRGSSLKWLVVGTGLLTAGCAGAIGAGAAAVVVGAGVLAMTCYDRVSVTVVDQVTGTKLCDAKVTFSEGKSVTEATSCYSAALQTGKYKLKVQRRGLVPYEAPVEINTGSSCRHAVQTIYVALERPNAQKGPQQIAPPAAAPAAPPAAAAPAASPAPTPSAAPVTTAAPGTSGASGAPSPAPSAAPVTVPAPAPAPAAPPAPAPVAPTPAPASSAFPNTP